MKRVSGKRMVKILENFEWYLDRVKGSHYIMKKEDEDFSITVPVHGDRDLRIGIQLNIMKSAGLTKRNL